MTISPTARGEKSVPIAAGLDKAATLGGEKITPVAVRVVIPSEAEGLIEGDGEIDAESDPLGEILGLTLALGESDPLGEILGLTLALGESDPLGEILGLTLALGDKEADGLTDAEGLSEALGEILALPAAAIVRKKASIARRCSCSRHLHRSQCSGISPC